MSEVVEEKPPTTKRQRVEGTVYRSLPAELTIREAESGQEEDGLLRLHISASSEEPYLRQSWWDDPWVEVLGHKEGEVDLSRFNGGSGVVLGNHDRWTAVGNTPLAGIGVIEKAVLKSRRLELDIVISRRESLADLRQDIRDGLVRNVSIGYQIGERTLTKDNGDKAPSEYRVTSWTPFEVSLVDIPADATVGLGRSLDGSESAKTNYRVFDISPVAGTTQGVRKMDPVVEAPANPAPAPQVRSVTVQDDPVAGERARMKDIRALGRQFGQQELAEKAIDDGMSVDAFNRSLLDVLKPAGKVRAAEDPSIGMSEKDLKQFSFARAMLYAMEPNNDGFRKAAAFEIECSEAARSKMMEQKKEREGGLTLPYDILRAPISNEFAAAERAARMLIDTAQRSSQFTRDLVVGTATAGGHLVATELLASSFIDLLRNKTMVIQMGATVLGGLSGNIAIPRLTGGASTYWVAESGAPTESTPSFDQLTMTPKTIGAYIDFSRRLLLQSSLDVEAFVRAQLAIYIALGLDLASLYGSGSSNQPTGVFNTVGIGAVVGGTNGAAPTWDHIVQLEEAVAVANADLGSLAYISNAKVRSKLKRTQKFSGTDGKEIWQPGRLPRQGIGELNGYDAFCTNQIPSNLTKGSASGVCSAIGFGNWADLVIGMWGGLDMMLDPYTAATSGGKRVVALQDCDIGVKHVGSFAAMVDALTT
jgi:HK97 family phage major capsid protein